MRLSELALGWTKSHPNALTVEFADSRRLGLTAVDLISPPAADTGLEFPLDLIHEVAESAVTMATVRQYAPDPLGQLISRNAIAAFYARRGTAADPAHIALTPGTSLAYLYAFRLLADAGHEVLVPTPGYPLFDDIAAITRVKVRKYHLRETPAGWRPDLDEIAFQITPQTRVLVVISPHNPAGTVWSAEELASLRTICEREELALVFDEVFSETVALPLRQLPRPEGFPLSITLNGVSKMFALPGWKIGWMKIDGESARVAPFMRAVEHLSDTFLPVGELQQAMVPGLIGAGDPAVSRALADEIARRRTLAVDLLTPHAPAPEGGIYLCARLPEGVDDEEFALTLLRDHGVLVHPGHYYDLPRHIVLTCLARPEVLRDALGRVRESLESRSAPAAGGDPTA